MHWKRIFCTRSRLAWLPVGVAVGVALGVALDDMALWVAVGVAVGVALSSGSARSC